MQYTSVLIIFLSSLVARTKHLTLKRKELKVYLFYSFVDFSLYLTGSKAWLKGSPFMAAANSNNERAKERKSMPPSCPDIMCWLHSRAGAALRTPIPVLDNKAITDATFGCLHDYMRFGGPPRHKP